MCELEFTTRHLIRELEKCFDSLARTGSAFSLRGGNDLSTRRV